MLRNEQDSGVEWNGKGLDHGRSEKPRRVNSVYPYPTPRTAVPWTCTRETDNEPFLQVPCLSLGTHLTAFQERPQVLTDLPNIKVTWVSWELEQVPAIFTIPGRYGNT